MTIFEKSVHAYLIAHGKSTQDVLYAALVKDGISVGAFRKRLERMEIAGHIANNAMQNQRGSWSVVPVRSVGDTPAPPRQYDMLKAPPLVHHDMQPVRRGASDHELLYASRRGDDLVRYQQPIHMCSALRGGMQ